MRFSEAINKYTEWGSGKHSQKTLNTYISYQRRFCQYIGDKHVEELSYFEDVNKFRLCLQNQGKKDNTINLYMVSLRQLFDMLRKFKKELKVELPFDKDVIPIKSDITPNSHLPIQADQFSKIIQSIKGDSFIVRRDVAILWTLYATGMRVSELTSLDISSIDFSSGTIRAITRKKRSKHKFREVPFLHACGLALKDYLKIRQSCNAGEALFVNCADFNRLTTRSIERMLKQRAVDAKVDPACAKPHCFRHGMTMRAVESELNPIYIKEMLGHSTLEGQRPYHNVKNVALVREYHDKMGDKREFVVDVESLS